MTKKDSLEELREENERLKKELEISKLERENRELREQIAANKKYAEFGDQPVFKTPYTVTCYSNAKELLNKFFNDEN